MAPPKYCVVLSVLVALLGAPAPALSANTPMTKFIDFPRTDVVNAGVGGIAAPGLEGGGAGQIELVGVSGSVTLALLYWHGIDIEWSPRFVGGNFDYDETDIVFDGVPLIGTRVAGYANNNGWPLRGPLDPPPPDSAAVYRADVTSRVQLRGNGTYSLSGLSDGGGHSTNGASLIVYFDDGNASNDVRVEHYEGQLSNNGGPWNFAFDVDYRGGNLDAVIHVADGQASLADGTLTLRASPGVPGVSGDASVRFGSPFIDGLPLFSGESVPAMAFGRASDGLRLWDIRRLPLASVVGAPGMYRLQTEWVSGGDAAALLVAQIVQPADPQDPMLTPSPHDFGDVPRNTVSAPQPFLLRNLFSHPITISGTPDVTRPTLYQVTAQTCSGRTLAPGATCSVDVACAPTGTGQFPPAAVRITFSAPPSQLTRASYAPISCYGIPTGAFSRLQITPASHNFGEHPAGSVSAPQRFVASNTGLLDLNIVRVRTYDRGFTPRYTVVSEDCGTRLLVPGASCLVDIVFEPAQVNNVSNPIANLDISYAATDNPSAPALAALTGRGIPVDNDLIFRNGFDL